MKILQVIDVFPPAAGGSADVAGRLSWELARRGHEVTIYTTDFHLKRAYIDSLKGAKVYAARNYVILGDKPLFMPRLLYSFKSILIVNSIGLSSNN